MSEKTRFDEQPDPYSVGTLLQYAAFFVVLFGGSYLADMAGQVFASAYAAMLVGAGVAFLLFIFRAKLGFQVAEDVDREEKSPVWQTVVAWIAIPLFCWYLYARAIPNAWHAAAFDNYSQAVGIGFTSGFLGAFFFSEIRALIAKKAQS